MTKSTDDGQQVRLTEAEIRKRIADQTARNVARRAQLAAAESAYRRVGADAELRGERPPEEPTELAAWRCELDAFERNRPYWERAALQARVAELEANLPAQRAEADALYEELRKCRRQYEDALRLVAHLQREFPKVDSEWNMAVSRADGARTEIKKLRAALSAEVAPR